MARIYFLKQNMPQFETLVYLKTLFRIVLSIAIVVIVTYLLTYTGLKGFYFLIASTLLSIGLLLFTFYSIALSSDDRLYLGHAIKEFIKRINHKKLQDL